jgi:hypothetical protein
MRRLAHFFARGRLQRPLFSTQAIPCERHRAATVRTKSKGALDVVGVVVVVVVDGVVCLSLLTFVVIIVLFFGCRTRFGGSPGPGKLEHPGAAWFWQGFWGDHRGREGEAVNQQKIEYLSGFEDQCPHAYTGL